MSEKPLSAASGQGSGMLGAVDIAPHPGLALLQRSLRQFMDNLWPDDLPTRLCIDYYPSENLIELSASWKGLEG